MSKYTRLINECVPLSEGIHPPAQIPERVSIDVRGREQHEEWLRDPKKCAEHGLDHSYEVMIYLKRWGGWLND